MKTLKSPIVKLSADGKKVTIECDVVWQEVNHMMTTRVSHGHLNPDYHKHPRVVQSSNTAVFIKSRHGHFQIPNDVLAAIAAVIEPRTTFAPQFKKSSKPGCVDCVSELPVTYQWQISDDPAPIGTFPPPVAKWDDIPNATEKEFNTSSIADGKWIRCIATNLSGSTVSQHAKKVSDKK